MPRTRAFMKSLLDPNREFRISRGTLSKHLTILLQTPWASGHNLYLHEGGRIFEEEVNQRGKGFLHVRGGTVRLWLGKIVRNWVISLELILLRQPTAELRGKVINQAVKILVPVLLDVHASVGNTDSALNVDDITGALKETFECIDSKRFLDAIANASIVDLEQLKLKGPSNTDELIEFWHLGYFQYSLKNMATIHSFRQNCDFLESLYNGAKCFLQVLDLKNDNEIVDNFLTSQLTLKEHQWRTILSRTKPTTNLSHWVIAISFWLLLNIIFLAVAGSKIGSVLVLINTGYFLVARYNAISFRRDVLPEYKIKSKVNYQDQQDLALDRISACVNLHAVKIRYLETNRTLTILKVKPQEKPKTASSPTSFLDVEAKSEGVVRKGKKEKKSAPEERQETASTNHKRLRSVDWTDSHVPRFSPNNPKDPTRPFPVEINGIPYGRAFCMFPGPIARKLTEEHGIDNLIDVASRSGSSKGDQGIVKASDCYVTKEGEFEAVAKLKFISSRHSEHSKGQVRVYMREGGRGRNGELLLIADGLQTDHQFSNS